MLLEQLPRKMLLQVVFGEKTIQVKRKLKGKKKVNEVFFIIDEREIKFIVTRFGHAEKILCLLYLI